MNESGSAAGDDARFQELLSAKWVAQALSAAAELGVFDALDEGPKNLAELAAALACEPEPLGRLVRVLCGEGLVFLDEVTRIFRITHLGRRFTSQGQRQLARFVGARSQWTPWAFLPEAIRTGKSAFELAHGQPLFEYLRERPDEAALYHQAVDAFTTVSAAALSELAAFSNVESVVDVGGGRGKLLVELLELHPGLRATLFDLAEVIDACRARGLDTRFDGRLELVAGDFFDGLPEGRDCYILKHVLHNWADEQIVELLSATAAAMKPNGTILVVEDLLVPGNHRDLARFMDLEMFVVTGVGRERSKLDFIPLIRQANLDLKQVVPLRESTYALVIGRRGLGRPGPA